MGSSTSTLSSNNNTLSEKKEWVEVSDWDDPWTVAKLEPCGHTLRWDPILFTSRHCPLCQKSISCISDGGVETSNETVSFKWGKRIYRLSTVQPSNDKKQQSPNNDGTRVTQRIQQAFDLVPGFKILQKGKMVYADGKKTDASSSKQQWWVPTKAKVTLVVMGTARGNEMTAPPADESASPWTMGFMLSLPIRVVQWTIHVSLLFAKSFLVPFVPSSWLLTNNNERPHQD